MYSEQEQSPIIRSLDNILADEKFSGSPQMSAFLRYVVTETLKGNADRIKAYTVAVDALGKSEAFDPQNDPSVRVLAKRLRSCLGEYHARASNPERIIEIRPGSYKPIFSNPQLPGSVAGSDKHHNVAVSVHGLLENSPTHPLGGNVGNSSSISISNKETLNGATSPVHRSQESSIPKSGGYAQQQADALVNATSANDQQNAQKMALSNSPFDLEWLYSALTPKRLSGALILSAVAMFMWGFSGPTSTPGNTDVASAERQGRYQLQLASAKDVDFLRQRPGIPTVVARANSTEDRDSQALLSSIDHVLSKFDHLQLLDSTHEYALANKWPEDYEIAVNTLVMNDSKKVTVNLIHAASGRITYSDELILNNSTLKSDAVARFSKNDIAAVELTVARIVQKNGPLFSDYKKQEEYSETMACVFSITADTNKNNTNEECLNKVVSSGQSQAIKHALRTEINLIKLAKISGSKRKAALKTTLASAQKGVDLAPYSAVAHTLMMRASRLSGDYKTALKHGNHAMNINALDSNNMLALSVLLDEMKKPAEANKMRKQASALSTTLSGKAL